MKIAILLVLATLSWGVLSAQRVQTGYKPFSGGLQYGPAANEVIPYRERGYTLIMPEDAKTMRGTIVMLDDMRIDLKDTTRSQFVHIDKQANPKGFAVLYIATGIPVDLYFSEASLEYVHSTLQQVLSEHGLADKPIFLVGAMVSGHRALKYIEYVRTSKAAWQPRIAGVVLSESAIDWVRMWYEAQKQVRDNATPTQNFEGHFISYLFQQQFHVTPAEKIDPYLQFSPYSYFDTKMSKPALFKDLAIRAYTYADTRYWFSAQGKGVYDSNYPDMSGFINEQKLAGNPRAELVVFHPSPTDPLMHEQRKQSSTWGLVDRQELVDWMGKQLK